MDNAFLKNTLKDLVLLRFTNHQRFMPIPNRRTLIVAVVLFAASCSKSGSPNPPANSTQVTVTIAFPDGHSYTCTDYSVSDTVNSGWPNIIDGRVDTVQPVIWLNDNNVYNGWDFYTYGITGETPGKSYSLIFSTPNHFNNSDIAESWNPSIWNPSLGWTLGSVSHFDFQGSTYEVRQLTVTAAVTDSSKKNPTNGSFSVALIADSVFTTTTRSAYSGGPIQITGTFRNLNIFP